MFLLTRAFLVFFLFPLSVFADQVVETFSTRDNLSAENAVWNQALGQVHPTLQAVSYGGGPAIPFSVGDGSHGAFELSRYAEFSLNGDISGNTIRLDQTRFPILKVTSFHLASGWKLEPAHDLPLVIYSLSTVSIEGEIWCHGDSGTNAVGATPGTGGQGRCGGGDGGNGGAPNANGTDGGDPAGAPAGSVTGGKGGDFQGATAVAGGGAGSWNTTSPVFGGTNSSATGGGAGTSSQDPTFSQPYGGAGGGGGSGTNTEGGAGGGGGGGAVIIHAVGEVSIGSAPTSATGVIKAYGGNGGSSNVNGGAGGGGSGGSVKIFTGGNVELYNSGNASDAYKGTYGTNASGEIGGDPGEGRSWVASVTYNTSTGTGTYVPTENGVTPGNNTIEFSESPQSVTTKAIDLLNTLATINSVTFSPASADFSYELRGSKDNFASDDTGWTTDLLAVSNKRYVQIRAIITTSNGDNPTMIDSVTIDYSPSNQNEFKFEATGCGTVGMLLPPPKLPPPSLLILLTALLLLPVIVLIRLQSQNLKLDN